MPRKKKQRISLYDPKSFLMLIIIQMIFILYMAGQYILIAPWNQEVVESTPSHATTQFFGYDFIATRIGSVTYKLYVADTPEKRQQGLSGIQSMDDVEGMIFVFDQPTIQSFWMYGMEMNLDFVFLQNGVVVDIVENVPPESYPETVSPRSPADAVIELRDNQIERSGLQIGDEIDL